MVTFQVDDMTCGRCAGLIVRAIRDTGEDVEVAVDVPARLVWVDGPDVDDAAIADAIREAGYTPADVDGRGR
jgi:copper chaperone